MKCTECYKEFHTCPSCDLIGYEWVFCSKKCFDNYLNDLYEAFEEEYPNIRQNESMVVSIVLRTLGAYRL